ncbi:hypothetical protein [Actinomycetospora termitidis]|uniref:Uncharacterized protein n=1 Tax=Actinomycetospora termitidis TaxID=3053470 RepID=A0ABT7M338_9PSEU|nr:hypothetical protein [Actinomycetospora sp. Odt1-22]MDL5155077.1 hypothetical protein [Actinomycetospora sp. Odt1-22]
MLTLDVTIMGGMPRPSRDLRNDHHVVRHRPNLLRMPDVVYGTAALEQARSEVATHARRLPALADLLGPAGQSSGVGGLRSAGLLAGALADCRAALETELTAGGARLDETDRALDATLRSMQAAETDTAGSLGARSFASGARGFAALG